MTLNQCALGLILALTSMASAAGGGTVVKLDGQGVVERKAIQIPLAESMPVYSGDVLTLQDGSNAQLRFEDDSVFVLPGSARLRIDQFAMPTSGSSGKAIFTLVNGGLRTITGTVSKGGEDQYELRTEEATITVAGSAYLALRCQGSCARKHKAGLYVKGESGTVFMTTVAGRLKLQRGQTGFVADKNSLPTHVRVSPFSDPGLFAEFGIDGEFDVEVHPPRIEQDPPASPS